MAKDKPVIDANNIDAQLAINSRMTESIDDHIARFQERNQRMIDKFAERKQRLLAEAVSLKKQKEDLIKEGKNG